eukprot:487906-Rhodomonas_salina.1
METGVFPHVPLSQSSGSERISYPDMGQISLQPTDAFGPVVQTARPRLGAASEIGVTCSTCAAKGCICGTRNPTGAAELSRSISCKKSGGGVNNRTLNFDHTKTPY